jgi:toxin ParE1/3/4
LPGAGFRVKWLKAALRNMDALEAFVDRHDPRAAASVIRRIHDSVMQLEHYPAMGRPGRVFGTRELVISDTPYIVPYRAKGKQIEILRVFHSAMRWPDRF